MAHDVSILGAGSWGTALAVHLGRSARRVVLWAHDPAQAERLASDRANLKYLPGYPLPPTVTIAPSLADALAAAPHILLAVPSHHCRQVVREASGGVTARQTFCVAAKGIENDTFLRVSQIVTEELGDPAPSRICALSGPSFAREVAEGHPTAVVAASADPAVGLLWQELLSAGGLRAYTNDDLIGVELGGALKNVIAIAAGVVEGLGHGSNTLAALITRGLAEMARLAEAMGARRETLSGLSGLGDLVLTCTGSLSRNRSLGIALGRGETLRNHQASTPMVAEGVRTTLSARRLAERHAVSMPITQQVHAVLYEGKPPASAIKELLSRQLTSEE
ncbi:MAG TPA: NAD(P)H-dependent glycerol-3-phosphate dehydrogenase [Candidatus Polarisedimenticolia bacterium]|nr:NAD(P)H-dependent glycerol-3-phosphate dehydrogenase [Candidatus Polarisedimenticolia bacterium]